MSTSLSKLVYNLSEIYTKNCRDKNCKSECEFKGLKNNKLFYNCKECRKKQLKPINGLIKTLSNTYKFCTIDINKFNLLLRKGVYPYEYMDSGKDLMKLHFQIKKLFTVNYILKMLQIILYTCSKSIYRISNKTPW